jgi:hypothetical protein
MQKGVEPNFRKILDACEFGHNMSRGGHRMNPDSLNRWLTLGANVGVLVGLLLLVFELNQNRDMIRAQTRNEMAAGIVAI